MSERAETPAAFDLSADDLRVVADVHPGDTRPRDAVAAARLFVGGAPRTTRLHGPPTAPHPSCGRFCGVIRPPRRAVAAPLN